MNIVVIAHDMRSTYNVGSLLRTAEGLGVSWVYLTGYTPHPAYEGDPRLPHVAIKQTHDIHKTALGAENQQAWKYATNVMHVINKLKEEGYQIIGLEQTPNSIRLPDFKSTSKVAVILGREVEGIDQSLLQLCDVTVEIPMFGNKESFNVVQASAMVLYHLALVTRL